MKRAVLGIFVFILSLTPAARADDETRTHNRTVTGSFLIPDKFFIKPPHAEFLPKNSNADVATQHPGAWVGQGWDTAAWGKTWTPDGTLKKFFAARIFTRQAMKNGKMPVLELGPTFYKLSDLDQRRSLKLLADASGVFRQGYALITLVDWSTQDTVGVYTPKGMSLY